MRCDIELAHEVCSKIGLSSIFRNANRLEITVVDGVVLCIWNANDENDFLIGFEGTQWHFHDHIMFADGQGYYIEMNYLEVLHGLADGIVLICEIRTDGQVTDRYLMHNTYNDEFKYLQPGEEFRIFRATVNHSR